MYMYMYISLCVKIILLVGLITLCISIIVINTVVVRTRSQLVLLTLRVKMSNKESSLVRKTMTIVVLVTMTKQILIHVSEHKTQTLYMF